jgi:hypothetical protein
MNENEERIIFKKPNSKNWKGNNCICCCGNIIAGPDWCLLTLTIILVLIPSILFPIFW